MRPDAGAERGELIGIERLARLPGIVLDLIQGDLACRQFRDRRVRSAQQGLQPAATTGQPAQYVPEALET